MTNMRDAVVEAVRTTREQPALVPRLPEGWLERADAAVLKGDDDALAAVALEIVRAHAGYRADFDEMAWLDGLREALWQQRVAKDLSRGSSP